MKSIVKVFYLLILVLSITQTQAQKKIEWTGTDQQKLMGLFTVWSETKFAFPFFDQIPNVNWDARVEEYVPKVLATIDVESYYEVLMEFAAVLNDGHTGVNPPWGPIKPGFDYPPLEVEMVENKFIITHVGETTEMKTQNIFPGLEVLAIDNIEIKKYYEENILRFNRRGTQQADAAINLRALFEGEKDSQIQLKIKDLKGNIKVLNVTRNSSLGSDKKFSCQLFNWYMFDPVLETKMLEDGLLYVKISNFNKQELVNLFQKTIQNNYISKGMIIDLRHNPGGESTIAEEIISMLIDDSVRTSIWHIPHYVAADKAWGNEDFWRKWEKTILPSEGKKYLGPLVILTSGGTYSAAEDFIIPLHHVKRAIIVGSKTAGSSGNPLRVQLPGGGNFRVVSVKMTYPDDKEYIGIGIKPDLEIYPTQLDIFNGDDPVLNKGIDVLNNWKTNINK
jgi:carboxyl-terminal processing protease